MITREEFIKSVPLDSEISGRSYDELVELIKKTGSNIESAEGHLKTIIDGFKGLNFWLLQNININFITTPNLPK